MMQMQAMPKPSISQATLASGMNDEDALDAAIAQSLGLLGSPDEHGDFHGLGVDGAALPPEAGVSFANIAKMGFAATGPKLSPGAPETGTVFECSNVFPSLFSWSPVEDEMACGRQCRDGLEPLIGQVCLLRTLKGQAKIAPLHVIVSSS